MTTVEVTYRYSTPPSQATSIALASARDVYGIRAVRLDTLAKTLCVEYDATRLNPATVSGLVRQTGLDIDEFAPAAPVEPIAAA